MDIKEFQNDFIQGLLEEPLFKLKAEKEREIRQYKRDIKYNYSQEKSELLDQAMMFLETINDWLTKIN